MKKIVSIRYNSDSRQVFKFRPEFMGHRTLKLMEYIKDNPEYQSQNDYNKKIKVI